MNTNSTPGTGARRLLVHPTLDAQKERKRLSELYDAGLSNRVRRPKVPADTTYNYAYYPVILDSEDVMKDVIVRLEQENIFPRRYFYSTFALSGLDRGGLGSAAKPVRPSGQAGRRCAPVAGVEFLRIGRLEWT
jgi:hypothetical protein